MPVDIALMLLGVTAFPVAGLGLLLWLTHLEETLERDVRSAVRTRTPAPVLAVPVKQPTGRSSLSRPLEAALIEGDNAGPDWSRQARPAVGEARPAVGEARPAVGEARPAVGEARPAVIEARPAGAEVRTAG